MKIKPFGNWTRINEVNSKIKFTIFKRNFPTNFMQSFLKQKQIFEEKIKVNMSNSNFESKIYPLFFYRDIKPDNILLDAAGKKIILFILNIFFC